MSLHWDEKSLTGAACRMARAALRVNAIEIADEAGVPRSTLALFETGRWIPDPTFLENIATVLQKRGVIWETNEEGDLTVTVAWGALRSAEFDKPRRGQPSDDKKSRIIATSKKTATKKRQK